MLILVWYTHSQYATNMDSKRIRGYFVLLAALYVLAQNTGIVKQNKRDTFVMRNSDSKYLITGPIPVHFVWISPNLANQTDKLDIGMFRAKQVAHEWMHILPTDRFKLMFWTNQEIFAEFPHLTPVLSKLSVAAWISDVLRYHVLLKYGGVYLDTDVRAVHDFSMLLDQPNYSFTVCEKPWEYTPSTSTSVITHSCNWMINAIIAAPPDHPAVKCAAEESMAYTRLAVTMGRHEYSLFGTGPPRWTKCIKQHGLVHVLPSWTFLPCSFPDRHTCNPHDYSEFSHVYGMHEWIFSWK
jgi:hypothetical protein